MKCLVIIPAYNEEENIVRVVENLKNNYPMYDYVVINDGSADSTAKICRKYGYELVDLPVNLGLAGAFQTGLKYAYRKGYDYAIQFDADGQHRPEFIAPMLDKIQEGYDIVIGFPVRDREEAPFPSDAGQQPDFRGHEADHGPQGQGSHLGHAPVQ